MLRGRKWSCLWKKCTSIFQERCLKKKIYTDKSDRWTQIMVPQISPGLPPEHSTTRHQWRDIRGTSFLWKNFAYPYRCRDYLTLNDYHTSVNQNKTVCFMKMIYLVNFPCVHHSNEVIQNWCSEWWGGEWDKAINWEDEQGSFWLKIPYLSNAFFLFKISSNKK